MAVTNLIQTSEEVYRLLFVYHWGASYTTTIPRMNALMVYKVMNSEIKLIEGPIQLDGLASQFNLDIHYQESYASEMEVSTITVQGQTKYLLLLPLIGTITNQELLPTYPVLFTSLFDKEGNFQYTNPTEDFYDFYILKEYDNSMEITVCLTSNSVSV